MNSGRSYSTFVCFIYGLEEKNSKTKVIFAVCRKFNKLRCVYSNNYGLSISDVLQSEDGDVDPGGGGHKYKKDRDAPRKF